VKAKKLDSQPDQSARFIEAAKAAGADETGKKFEKVFKKVVPKSKVPRGRKHRKNGD